jgi:hypothetical protein
MTVTFNEEVYQGDDFAIPIRIKSGGVVVDLTGSTFVGMVRVALGDASPVATFSFAMPTPSTGQITATLTRTQTLSFPLSRVFYDIAWIDAGGVRNTIIRGSLLVLKPITR